MRIGYQRRGSTASSAAAWQRVYIHAGIQMDDFGQMAQALIQQNYLFGRGSFLRAEDIGSTLLAVKWLEISQAI